MFLKYYICLLRNICDGRLLKKTNKTSRLHRCFNSYGVTYTFVNDVDIHKQKILNKSNTSLW